MALNWLFEIGTYNSPTYRWSLAGMVFNSNTYTAKVLPESFDGVVQNRVKVEMGQITRSEISFEVVGSFDLSTIVGQPLVIKQVTGSDILDLVNYWRFSIENASYVYGITTIIAVDILTSVIDGTSPTTPFIRDLYPESVFTHAGIDDSACVPLVFGDSSYIPLQSKSVSGDVHYILGAGNGSTYTLEKITSPHNIDNPTSYTVGTDIWTTQTADGSYEVMQPFLESGKVTAVFWKSGADRVPPHVMYNEDDYYINLANPLDVLQYFLEDAGIISTVFGDSWVSVATAIDTRGYTYSKGFYQPEDRVKLTCHLLACSDASIYQQYGRVEVGLNSKTSVATIDSSKVVKSSFYETGDFSWNRTIPSKNDSAYITWFVHGHPQVKLMKAKVPVATTSTNPSTEVMDFSGVSDSQSVQKLGTLFFRKKYTRNGECSFTGVPELADLLPGQVITIDDALYGPTTTAVIESIKILRDSTVKITASTYSLALVDFEDLSPAAITPIEDTATNPISTLSQAVESGPYIPVVYIPGVLTADQVLLYHVFSFQGASFPVDLDGSTAKAMDAATAETVVDIQKNGTSIGSITWAAAGTNGTFTFTTETAFVEGDTLSLIAPSTADTTLGYVSVSLRGTKI